ncbi:hypothetical protein TEA_014891 [Camellia sinensis var. sinensis]|uniref:Uncharacterized protein n=1 Tax=Camellia sinensis var. sinensis TaxID=542762 RepID=A0A4S4E041_CAMSN|nr:hypothetical protein TEA_014891 [Camellia sinensis var. sinensis]
MEQSFFNLIYFLHCPGLAETFLDVLLSSVSIWLAVMIGLVIEKEQSALRAQSSSIRSSKSQAKIAEESVPKTVKFQPFIKEEALVSIHNDVFLSTAEQFFDLLLNDDSNFINEYRSVRKDTNLTVIETVQQAHDVPFGYYFEASQALLEWLMKKQKAFDRQGDMVVAAWAEQQQHEMNLRSLANYRWVVSCIAEATRSSMSPGSVHCSRACNLLAQDRMQKQRRSRMKLQNSSKNQTAENSEAAQNSEFSNGEFQQISSQHSPSMHTEAAKIWTRQINTALFKAKICFEDTATRTSTEAEPTD